MNDENDTNQEHFNLGESRAEAAAEREMELMENQHNRELARLRAELSQAEHARDHANAAYDSILALCERQQKTIDSATAERDANAAACERLRAIVEPLDRLRADDGASVEIMCPNHDDGPNEAIEVSDDWTDWRWRRFTGDTLAAALAAAEQARKDRP